MPGKPLDEEDRLEALKVSRLREGSADPVFHRLTAFATEAFRVPMATISLVDSARQTYFSAVGFSLPFMDRDDSFCSVAVQSNEPLVVLDASLDPRFENNPAVLGNPHIRFYAGYPVRFRGQPIGTFCLVDTEPHNVFSDEQLRRLQRHAILAEELIELRFLRIEKEQDASRFERMAATTPDAMLVIADNGRLLTWNASAERLFGYTAQEALLLTFTDLLPRRSRRVDRKGFQLAAHAGTTHDIIGQARNGRQLTLECSISTWCEAGRTVFGAVMRDISERKVVEARLYELAHRDPLTELPNRAVFFARLQETLARGQHAGVLLLDLDGFKDINDKLGHGAGDDILKIAGARIVSCVDRLHTVARIGGDEFAILLPQLADRSEAIAIADDIVKAIAAPFDAQDRELHVGISVGIAFGPADGATPDDLLSSADLALYKAKGDGRHCFRLYTPVLRDAAIAQRRYSQDIRRAVANREFVLFYQPQVRLTDGVVTGAEALIRWQHPESGLLSPAAFLSTVTTSQYAREIADWVLEEACSQAAAWRRQGLEDFKVAVNLCQSQIRSGDLLRSVEAILGRTGLHASGLELELTETLVLGCDDYDTAPMTALVEAGVGLALDDYGTGYASLSMLKDYPLTRLKIDRSFVREMVDIADVTIIRAIIGLAKGFGLDVTAEGIESEAQLQRLRRKGCGFGQGYLFGKPMPAAEFQARFVSQKI